jgi:hypothetical protein
MPGNGVRRSVIAALVTVAVLVVPTACTDSSTESQPSPSATAAPPPTGESATDCAASTELKSSLETLRNVEPLQDGLTALNTAMAGVRTNLAAAAASASAVLQPAVANVKTAFTELEAAASGLTADNFRQKAPAINTALRQLGTAASSFATTLTQSCPGG